MIVRNRAAGDMVKYVLLQDAVKRLIGEGKSKKRPLNESAVARRPGAGLEEQIHGCHVLGQVGVVIEEATVADVEQVADAADFPLHDTFDVLIALQFRL